MLYGAMNFPLRPIINELEAISMLDFDYLELTMDPPQAHYKIIHKQKEKILIGISPKKSLSIKTERDSI